MNHSDCMIKEYVTGDFTGKDKKDSKNNTVLITNKHRCATGSCYDAVLPGGSWQSTGLHSEAPVILAGSADKC